MRRSRSPRENPREVRELLAPVLALLLAGVVSTAMESPPGRLAVQAAHHVSQSNGRALPGELPEALMRGPVEFLRGEVKSAVRDTSSEIREQWRIVRHELRILLKAPWGNRIPAIPMITAPMRLSERRAMPPQAQTERECASGAVGNLGDCA